MTKAELVSRIVDSFEELFGQTCPFDYEWLDGITLKKATDCLAACRAVEDSADLEDSKRLPKEVTPELYMEAFNCYLRRMQHECRVLRLAKYITDNCMVCEYDNYFTDGSTEVIPTDLLRRVFDLNSIPINEEIDMLDFIQICQHSPNFNRDMEFFYYSSACDALISTDNPFRDGVLDARSFAEFILSPEGRECLSYILGNMDDNDVQEVFRTKKEEV